MLVEENFHSVFDIEIKQCTYNNKAMISDGKVASGWRNYVTELPKSKTAPSGLVFTPTARQWAAFQFIAVANGSQNESNFQLIQGIDTHTKHQQRSAVRFD